MMSICSSSTTTFVLASAVHSTGISSASPDIDGIIRMRLEHTLEATDAAAEFLAELPPDADELDLKTTYAFRAVVITLGEAANRIPESYRERHTDVPWAEIRQYRNFMVHVYHAVDAERM